MSEHNCPQCTLNNTYFDGSQWVCADCAYEWQLESTDVQDTPKVVKDAHGTELMTGDTVILTKDLKLKGSSSTLKSGTKVKNIRIVEGDHDIECKLEGYGAIQLKSVFVKKAS